MKKLGFEDGENSITLGLKMRADAVYDHSAGSTAQIAGEIYEKVKELMVQSRVQDEEKDGGFVKRYPSRKRKEKPSEKEDEFIRKNRPR